MIWALIRVRYAAFSPTTASANSSHLVAKIKIKGKERSTFHDSVLLVILLGRRRRLLRPLMLPEKKDTVRQRGRQTDTHMLDKQTR